jgi:hypothetical protein
MDMRTLSVEDLSRIVNWADQFLLVDVSRNGSMLPGAVRVPFPDDDFASEVLERAGHLTLPVVVYGDGEDCPTAANAAAQLMAAGLVEVWLYCGDATPWGGRESALMSRRQYVLADPDVAYR